MSKATKYFKHLNYSLANEDTTLELRLCQQHKPKHILSICGSGGRFLPLFAAHPASVVALDLAEQQLYLAEMREESMRKLSYNDFLAFWGYPPYAPGVMTRERQTWFRSFQLSDAAREYCAELLQRHRWHGLIYAGKWERTFIGVAKVIKHLIGDRYDEIFAFDQVQSQQDYFDEKLANNRWKFVPRLVLRIFGNAAFFNAVLYKGHFVRKNIDEGYYDFYRQAFRRLFANGLTRHNFFLQLCFLGVLRFPEGNPVEADPAVFALVQAALRKGQPTKRVQSDLLAYAASTTERFDFVSLSDVPSYFAGDVERTYLQQLKVCLNPGALCVVRCYLRIPEGTDLTGFRDVTADYAALIAAEKTQVYRIFIYQYLGLS